MLHVSIIMMHVVINKLDVNIMMLHVDMIILRIPSNSMPPFICYSKGIILFITVERESLYSFLKFYALTPCSRHPLPSIFSSDV